ncbi:MAG: hypothetical protein J6C90_01805 [Clostridia bacterium]|nr:hypothetical protein [Clostridia bacterium]
MKLLASVFDHIINFFNTVGSYISFDILMYASLGVMVLLIIVLAIQVRNSFELRMVRAIDSLNNFLVNNPKITDDNLVAFNDKMKKVPNSLRIQWQQFMLYREGKPSHYMSFKNCVENPMKSTSYKHTLANNSILAGVVIALVSILAIFANGGIITDLSKFAKYVLLLPLVLGVLYYVSYVIISARLSAITSDLFQNFQYFEKNIDKATQTLPDYVDYEVLFSKREIRQGIPVLFEYLEKRAQVEQQELEKAREKNVEHEKYNFDKAGLEPSLVLDRAMHEAERYLSDRNRFMQEIEKSENEINSIQGKFKEYTKEYQRKMQASKENVERLKTQLDQAASNIEANYIKKQYSDEINRQQMLEKEFDGKSDENRQNILVLQQDIENKHQEIDKLRVILEDSMMSEFDSYSKKVYDKVEDAVNKQQQKRMQNIDTARIQAEERLAEKERELERLYDQYHTQTERLEKRNVEYSQMLREKNEEIESLQKTSAFSKNKKKNKRDRDDDDIMPAKSPIMLEDDIAPAPIMDDIAREITPAKSIDDELKNDIQDEIKPVAIAEDIKPIEQSRNKVDDLLFAEDQKNEPLFDLPTNDDPIANDLPGNDKNAGILEDLFSEPQDDARDDIKQKVKDIKKHKQEALSGNTSERATDLATEELRAAFLNRNKAVEEPTITEPVATIAPTKPTDDDDILMPKRNLMDDILANNKTDDILAETKEEPLDTNDIFASLDYADSLGFGDNDEKPTDSSPVLEMVEDDEDDIVEPDIVDEIPTQKEDSPKPAGKRGRPRKEKKIVYSTPKPRGRPKKEVNIEDQGKPEKVSTGKRGRPRKEDTEPKTTTPVASAKRGRPKKDSTAPAQDKKTRGRPKKEAADVKPATTGKRGRPKKDDTEPKTTTAKRGRPRKDDSTASTPKTTTAKRGRPKKETTEVKSTGTGKRGRPKKSQSVDQQLQALSAKILEESRELDAQRAALENEIDLGFNTAELNKKRQENEENQKLLDSIISQLDILSSTALGNKSTADQSTIEDGIKYLSEDLDKLSGKSKKKK